MTLPINSVGCGDNLTVMKTFEDNSIDAIVTDPPYALTTTARWKDTSKFAENQSDVGKRFSKGFMGTEWDGELPGIETWEECLRVAKPGAHMLAFGGTRTHHRLMVAIEDAGWEIRDCLMWVYGSGFPKSLDVSKAIDKAAGVEREVVGLNPLASKQTGQSGTVALSGDRNPNLYITTPTTDAAKQWNGWGTALKPAWEPIILFRKPLDGTIANNILKWGVGGINIDACRVKGYKGTGVWGSSNKTCQDGRIFNQSPSGDAYRSEQSTLGRFPANFIHDGSDDIMEMFPDTKSGATKRNIDAYDGESITGFLRGVSNPQNQHGDSGSAARFFYSAKASRSERDAGLNDFVSDDTRTTPMAGRGQAGLKCKVCGHHWKNSGSPCMCENPEWEQSQFVSPTNRNVHPTVKPLSLMQYLTKLITPKNGIVLDPFTGSGSTCIAAVKEGFNYIGIEKESEYVEIAEKRIAYYKGLKDVTD